MTHPLPPFLFCFFSCWCNPLGSSKLGKLGVVNHVPYTASKHALEGMTKALAIELAEADGNVTVNSISPGSVATNMNPSGARASPPPTPPLPC